MKNLAMWIHAIFTSMSTNESDNTEMNIFKGGKSCYKNIRNIYNITRIDDLNVKIDEVERIMRILSDVSRRIEEKKQLLSYKTYSYF